MYELILKLIIGILTLLFSTKVFIKLAEKLSSSFKISPLIIGMTVVAIGTSLPELAVSAVASARNDIGLAMGNIVGSNIINIFMVFPFAILVNKLRVGTTKTQWNALILLVATILFIVLHFLPGSGIPIGPILISLAVLITFAEYKWAIFGRKHEDLIKLKKIENTTFTSVDLFKCLLATVGIIMGGYLTVIAVEGISVLTEYSTTVLGLSLTAIATSLPELLATTFSQKNNQEKLAIGNIIGSNIYNLLLIGGVVFTVSPAATVPITEWGILALATLLFILVIKYYKGRNIPRWVGLVLLLCFVGYIYLLSTLHYLP